MAKKSNRLPRKASDGNSTFRDSAVQRLKRILIPTGALIEKLASDKYFMLFAGISSILGLLIAFPTLKAQYQSWSIDSLHWKSEYIDYVTTNRDILKVFEKKEYGFKANLYPIDFSGDPMNPFWRDFASSIAQYDQVAVSRFQQILERLITEAGGYSSVNTIVPETSLYYLFIRYKGMQHLYLSGNSDTLLLDYVKLLSSFVGAAARIQSPFLCRTIAFQYNELIDLASFGSMIPDRFERVYSYAHVGYVNLASAFPETNVLSLWLELLVRFDDIVLANHNRWPEALKLAKYKQYVVAQLFKKRRDIVGIRLALAHMCSFGLRCEESGITIAASFVRAFCLNFADDWKTDLAYRALLEDMLQFFLKMSCLTADKKDGSGYESACGMAGACSGVGDERCMHIINGFVATLSKEKLAIFDQFRSSYFKKTNRYLLPQCPESF